MVFKYSLISVFLIIHVSNAAVFLWSNKELEVSPLQPFTTEQFSNLIKQLDNPEVYIFKSPSALSSNIKEITRGYYSVYIPNGEYEDISIEDTTDLLGDSESDIPKIKEMLSKSTDRENSTNNFLAIVFLPSKLFKREATEKRNEATYKGSVIYKGQNKSNLYALLYSSQPLLLKINGTEPIELHLGKAHPDMIIYDNRLNVNVIPLEPGTKVTLRFSFSWLNGYWSLPSVKVSDTNSNRDYDLTTDEDITAPAHFSYHCNGHTVFSDANGVELHIYDLQVQTDSKNGKFGDANDCVPFTTAPIWSGLFVTTILGIGLIIALTAIMDIKTMDKFDNHKTKNLTITISE